jgi:hypothetical protein
MRTKLFALLLCGFTPLLVLAQSNEETQDTAPPVKGTYTGVGKHGERVFSDQPVPGGKKVELDPAQTYKAPTVRAASGARQATASTPFQYQSCAIAMPANDETFINPEGVSIAVRLQPGLRAGDTIAIAVDGQQIASGQVSARVQPVLRGTHSVSATVRDSSGQVICSSPSSVFHVRQTTVNQGNRARQNTTPRRP